MMQELYKGFEFACGFETLPNRIWHWFCFFRAHPIAWMRRNAYVAEFFEKLVCI